MLIENYLIILFAICQVVNNESCDWQALGQSANATAGLSEWEIVWKI